MPILEVEQAQAVFVVKRSLKPGYAGVKNPLFENANTMMLYGDAKEVLQGARRGGGALIHGAGRSVGNSLYSGRCACSGRRCSPNSAFDLPRFWPFAYARSVAIETTTKFRLRRPIALFVTRQITRGRSTHRIPVRCRQRVATATSRPRGDPAIFEHPWPLEGAHASVACLTCHTGTPPVYVGLSTECVTCHADDFLTSTFPGHDSFSDHVPGLPYAGGLVASIGKRSPSRRSLPHQQRKALRLRVPRLPQSGARFCDGWTQHRLHRLPFGHSRTQPNGRGA